MTASFQEEWVIDKNQKDLWENILDQDAISPEYLHKVLPIAPISFEEGNFSPTIFACKMETFVEPTLLYENETVEVYYPGKPRVRNHLWIVLKRPTTSFLELTKEELLSVKDIENTICKTLSQKLELSSVITQSNTLQPGQIPNRFTVEIIPSRDDSKGVHNILDKHDCNNYVLFKGKFPSSFPLPTKSEMEEDIHFWKTTLLHINPFHFSEKDTDEPIEKWTQVQTSTSLADKKRAQDFYQILVEKGLKIAIKPSSYALSDEPRIFEKQGCPFCMEKVIQSQKVYESTFSYIIYNHKSSIPGSHFLIIPKRHVRFSSDLRKEETEEMQCLAQKLTRAIQLEKNRSDIKMYIQDGPFVGQTVPHVNMHVLLTPSPLKFMLFSINYNQEEPVSPTEMESLVEGVKRRLNNL